MKKIYLTTIMILSLAINAFAIEEGVDYLTLENPIPNKEGTLIKISSYDCPFCYAYENSVMAELLPKLEGTLVYEPWFLKEKGTYGREFADVMAALMVKDMQDGVSITSDKSVFKKAKLAYYVGYHIEKNHWTSGADEFIEHGLKAANVSLAEYKQLLSTKQAQDLLKTWDKSLTYAQIRGIPSFIVDGKYIMFNESPKSLEQMAELLKNISKLSK